MIELDHKARTRIIKALRDEAEALRRLASGRPKDDRDALLDESVEFDALAEQFKQ